MRSLHQPPHSPPPTADGNSSPNDARSEASPEEHGPRRGPHGLRRVLVRQSLHGRGHPRSRAANARCLAWYWYDETMRIRSGSRGPRRYRRPKRFSTQCLSSPSSPEGGGVEAGGGGTGLRRARLGGHRQRPRTDICDHRADLACAVDRHDRRIDQVQRTRVGHAFLTVSWGCPVRNRMMHALRESDPSRAETRLAVFRHQVRVRPQAGPPTQGHHIVGVT